MKCMAQVIIGYLQKFALILRTIVCFVVVKEFKALEDFMELAQLLVRRKEV